MSSNFKDIKSGVFWVLLFSLIGGPLALVRNWLITTYDSTGEMIGDFALLMIMFNIIGTFFTFGGSSVLTNFIPKIEGLKKQDNFFKSYILINLVLFLLVSSLILFFPRFITFVSQNKIDDSKFIYLLLLGFPIAIFNIFIYYFQGKKNYRLSSFLSQGPNICYLLFVAVFSLFNLFKYPIEFKQSYFFTFGIVLFFACIVSILISIKQYRKDLGKIDFNFYLPKKFWSFTVHVHLLTILTFAFQNIDQLFVLDIIGVKALGFYFIIIQLVEMIKFIPSKIGQVLLASFSSIIKNKNSDELIETYGKVSYAVIILNLVCCVVILLFCKLILNFYNIIDATYFLAIIILVIAASIGNLGNINSMVILANDKSKEFFINSCIIISVQIAVTYLLRDLLMIGIVVGRLVAILIGQIGLFYIVRNHVNKKLVIDKNYLFSQFIVIVLSAITFYLNSDSIITSIVIGIIVFISIAFFYKLSYIKVKRMLLNK